MFSFSDSITEIKLMSSLDATGYGLGPNMQQTVHILNNSKFERYLRAVTTEYWTTLHGLRNAPLTQLEVRHDQQQTDPLERMDEASVNSSLIAFLLSVGSMYPSFTRRRRTSRITLEANFGRVSGDPQLPVVHRHCGRTTSRSHKTDDELLGCNCEIDRP